MSEEPADKRLFLLRHPIVVGFAIIVLFGVLHVFAGAAGVLLLGFLSILLAALLSYPIDFFSRFMPRPLAMVLTIVLVVGAVVGLGLITVPILTAQATRFLEQIPVALARLSAWWDGLRRSGTVPEALTPGPAARLAGEAEALLARAVPFAMSVGSVVFTAFLLFVLALFLAYSPMSYREGLRSLVPREHEPLLDEAWNRLGTTLRHWTTGIVLSMITMGVLAAVGLYVARIDGWFLLGLLTFLGTFVPYVGAIASAVPGLMVGLAESPRRFLYAMVVYIVVHLVEGYLVSPFIMKYSVRLQPGVLLFWQLLVATIFGLPGIIVATPLLACIQVGVGFFYVERRLGKEPPRP
jgi:predicted PurR-regulated permease PerM